MGADLQTLRNTVRGPALQVPATPARRVLLPTRDGSGDQLSCAIEGAAAKAAPMVVLIHGLGGCEDSDYVRVSASVAGQRGLAVTRLNLRGAGVSRPTCRLQYHAGRTADVADALTALAGDHGVASFFLVGYSLGGNLVLKFLAEYGSSFPIVGAATVSAPLDLEAACARILEPRNRLYQYSLLGRMREEALGEGAQLSSVERRAVVESRTILQFDQEFVAPRNGYASALEYYEANSSRRFLPDIETPTLVIHSLDDPWIPPQSYRAFDWSSNPNLTPLLSDGGGHVGFHGAGARVPWHDRCIEAFLRDVTGSADASSADRRDS